MKGRRDKSQEHKTECEANVTLTNTSQSPRVRSWLADTRREEGGMPHPDLKIRANRKTCVVGILESTCAVLVRRTGLRSEFKQEFLGGGARRTDNSRDCQKYLFPFASGFAIKSAAAGASRSQSSKHTTQHSTLLLFPLFLLGSAPLGHAVFVSDPTLRLVGVRGPWKTRKTTAGVVGGGRRV